MIPSDVEREILRLHHVEKWRPGTIARFLAVHFITVKRVIGREHRESGLLARLLLAMPPQHTKIRCEENVPPECEAMYALLIERLRELEPMQTAEGPEPVVLRMTAEAKRCARRCRSWDQGLE